MVLATKTQQQWSTKVQAETQPVERARLPVHIAAPTRCRIGFCHQKTNSTNFANMLGNKPRVLRRHCARRLAHSALVFRLTSFGVLLRTALATRGDCWNVLDVIRTQWVDAANIARSL